MEIALNILNGFCVIADVVPFHCDTLDEAEDAFRTVTRALIRVNTMDSIFKKEVNRTNRIGVGITGVHEFAWKFFGYGFKDLVDEKKSKDFWLTLARFNRAVSDEAKKYSKELGLKIPHTKTTCKPSGCCNPTTEIKTTNGVKSLNQIFIEQGIFIDDFEDMCDIWFDLKNPIIVLDSNNDEQLVNKLYINGLAETLKVTFEDGYEIDVTPNHKFLTSDGWKRADELTGEEDIIQY